MTAFWVAGAIATGLVSGAAATAMFAVPGLVRAAERLPAPVPALLGIVTVSTPGRLLDVALFGLVAPILFLTYAIGVGSRATPPKPAGQPPVARSAAAPGSPAWALAEVAALAIGIALIGVALWGATAIGAAAGGIGVEPPRLLSAVLAAAMLGLVFGAAALAVRAATDRMVLASWTATFLAIGADAANSLAATGRGLVPLRYASPVYYAESGQPAAHGVSMAHLGILAAIAAAVVVTVVIVSSRRPTESRSDTGLSAQPGGLR
jgi:ABC-2 type transport system permease protein